MKAPLKADNLKVFTTSHGEILMEPSYIGYLRENGYTIEGVVNPMMVYTNSETAHLVVQIETYQYPRDDDRLDVAEDRITIPVCDCWSFRSNSNDVQEDVPPGGDCKHIREAYKTEKAKADDNQQELEDV